ncbi:hypothetical protein E1A91_D07G032500v1 [Gossypium mustelinum]|uniref:Uncharacterized protein n=1 Tax=Gossypium mustelinum TaxID=34275 RepID=A0A5D2U595_GOSMU|nr:hypothetical protein E1A91_D07G032500v1 [Gossypium mustelinum]
MTTLTTTKSAFSNFFLYISWLKPGFAVVFMLDSNHKCYFCGLSLCIEIKRIPVVLAYLLIIYTFVGFKSFANCNFQSLLSTRYTRFKSLKHDLYGRAYEIYSFFKNLL